MSRRLKLLPLIASGLLSTGCIPIDRAAMRTLEINQGQRLDTYNGAFKIDVSRLPPDAIEARVDRLGRDGPVTSLRVKSKYPVTVVLVPATRPSAPTE